MATVANNAQVSALYAAVFGRAPDKAGLDFWTAQLDGGATLATTAAGFVGHPVFTQTYGSLTNIQFVNQVYQNVLGSSGDAKGVQFWVNKLANEGYSKAQFIAEFVQGALTIDLAAQLASGALTQAEYDAAVTRQNTLTNKADVGVSFANTFGASSNLSASTDASSANVVNDAAYKAGAAAIAGVTADKSTADAAKTAIADAAKTANPVSSLSGNLANAGTGLKLAAYQSALKTESDLAASIVKTAVANSVAGITTTTDVTDANLKAAVTAAQNELLKDQQGVNNAQAALDNARLAKSDADVAKAAAAAQTEVSSVASALLNANGELVKTAGVSADGTVTIGTSGGSTAITADQVTALNKLISALGLVDANGKAYTVTNTSVQADVDKIFTAVKSDLAKDITLAQAQAVSTNANKALAADVAANGTDAKLASDLSAIITKLTAVSDSKFYVDTANKTEPTGNAVYDAYKAYQQSQTDATIKSLLTAAAADTTGDNTQNATLKVQYANEVSLVTTRTGLEKTATDAASDVTTAAKTISEIAAQNTRNTEIKAVADAKDEVTKDQALVSTLTKAQSDFSTAEKAVADAKTALGTDVTVTNVTSATSGSVVGNTDKADIFVFNVDSAAKTGGFNISLDNSIDKLFIGKDYVQGADITKGNNSALEFFVKDVNGNAVVSVETSAFGSSAATPEVIQITLTGHSAADVSFASGFITTSAPATA
ncbi:DUF4214 domain-containing protein [Pseudomonas oryzihabitans]|uniref:DUF4214 domain-containing protein n=1 Tax=Pseudomonas oryzihabitans TaxID=47885 RepID=UPI003741FEAA